VSNRPFLELFVVSTARAALAPYENACHAALQGTDPGFRENAPVVFDDLASLEANLPYIVQFVSPHAASFTKNLLQKPIDLVREATKSILRADLPAQELIKQAGDIVSTQGYGPLQQANQRLRERIEQYAATLATEADGVLAELSTQTSVAELIEHSKKLLDVVRIDPTKSEHHVLAQKVETRIRDFIGLVDEAIGQEVRGFAEKMQTLSKQGAANAHRWEEAARETLVSDIARGVQVLYQMVRELRIIRDGVAEYHDLLIPPEVSDGSPTLVRRASVDEVASLMIDEHVGAVSRALRPYKDILGEVWDMHSEHLQKNDTDARIAAEEIHAGLRLLRFANPLRSRGSRGPVS
jgi:hypothetical protein